MEDRSVCLLYLVVIRLHRQSVKCLPCQALYFSKVNQDPSVSEKQMVLRVEVPVSPLPELCRGKECDSGDRNFYESVVT